MYSLDFFFKRRYIYLFERSGEISYLLACSPKAYIQLGLGQVEAPGTKNSTQVSQCTWAILCCLPDTLAGSCVGSLELPGPEPAL